MMKEKAGLNMMEAFQIKFSKYLSVGKMREMLKQMLSGYQYWSKLRLRIKVVLSFIYFGYGYEHLNIYLAMVTNDFLRIVRTERSSRYLS